MFLYALTLFTIGSALCGVAWNLDVMIISRVVQALGASIINNIILAQGFVGGMDDTYWITFLLAVLAWILNWFFASSHEESIRRGKMHI